MFLNRDFRMAKIVSMGSHYFPGKKIEVLIFYKKYTKPSPNCKKNLPGIQTFE